MDWPDTSSCASSNCACSSVARISCWLVSFSIVSGADDDDDDDDDDDAIGIGVLRNIVLFAVT